MSNVMNEHIRHLQERLAKVERERDAALEALRPFAEAYREQLKPYVGRAVTLTVRNEDKWGGVLLQDFARAAEMVGATEKVAEAG